MRRARVAINAAVLAAAVRVDGLLVRNVRRAVAADDAARLLDRDGGGERRGRFIILRPAVVKSFAVKLFETPLEIERSATPLGKRHTMYQGICDRNLIITLCLP